MNGKTPLLRTFIALSMAWWLPVQAALADVEALLNQYKPFETKPAWHALVIGTWAYQHLLRLDSAEVDGQEMARKLEQLGFTVAPVRSLRSIDELEREIMPQFRAKLKRGDFVVVFLSGHGFTVGADNYYAAEDTPLLLHKDLVHRHAVTVEGLQDYFAASEPGEMLFLVDACRTMGEFQVRSGDGPNEARPGMASTPGLQDPSPTPGPGALAGIGGISKGTGSGTGDKPWRRVNTQVGYAARGGSAAFGFTGSGKTSVFTGAVLQHLPARGREFADVWKDIGFLVEQETGGLQQPMIASASYADVYFNPDEDAAADALEAWRTALANGTRSHVEYFARRHALSPHAAAARRWLADHHNAAQPSTAVAVPPAEIERQWSPGQVPLAATSTQGGLAYARSMTFTPAKPTDAVIGRAGSQPAAGPASLYRQLETMRSYGRAVTTQPFVARTAPDAASLIEGTVPTGTPLAIDEVRRAGDGSAWITARLPGEVQRIFLRVKSSSEGQTIPLGVPLAEVVVPPRRTALSDLVDAALLVQVLESLRQAGKEIQWVSLSTGTAGGGREAWARLARTAHAAFILSSRGVDPRRITSVNDVPDLEGPGVRVRIFGR